MYIDHECVRCRHALRVRRCYQGKKVRCPGCAAVQIVPTAPAAASETRSAISPRTSQITWTVPSEIAYSAGRNAPLPPTAGGGSPAWALLPWLLLAPAILALGLLGWMGQGVLWAALGVGLGGLCLLVGQRGSWPMSLRVGSSLSLALLGHGLTLAAPRLNAPVLQPLRIAAGQPSEAPELLPINLPPPSQTPDPVPVRRPKDPRAGLRTPQAVTDLVPAGRIDPLLAVAVAVDANGQGSAFVSATDGSLKKFSYPTFELQTVYRLRQTAYRAVVDARRKRLWVAACDPAVLRINEFGDRPEGPGDLHVYDLDAMRRSEGTVASLQPQQILPVRGTVLELLASPDSRWLFYLARTVAGVHLGRIDAERCRLDATLPLPEATRALCGTADGATLYAAGGRNVFVIDPASLRLRRHLERDADFNDIAAENGGRVYLAEEGQWTRLTRLDLNGAEPEVWQWSPRLHGRVYLRIAPDQFRLYAGTSSVISNHLDSLLIGGHGWKTPPQVGMAVPAPQRPVRGEFFLTPDGKYLINRWGRIFRLTQGEMNLPHLEMPKPEH